MKALSNDQQEFMNFLFANTSVQERKENNAMGMFHIAISRKFESDFVEFNNIHDQWDEAIENDADDSVIDALEERQDNIRQAVNAFVLSILAKEVLNAISDDSNAKAKLLNTIFNRSNDIVIASSK